jgi:hypothetical protein
MKKRRALTTLLILPLTVIGCAHLFGWDIHAPGILSAYFYTQVTPAAERVALFLPESITSLVSTDRGGRLADPQTYHVGEAFAPMAVEAFQRSFDEFVFVETEPSPELMALYEIPYLAVIEPIDFGNRVTLKGQAVEMSTKITILNKDFGQLVQYKAKGMSDARRVFAKKGGPEVNLNAALESNLTATVQYLQEWIRQEGHINDVS